MYIKAGIEFTNSLDERRIIASDPSTRSSTLLALAEDPSTSVRCGVASNPNSPVEALELLSSERDLAILHALAKNQNAPASVLRHVAGARFRSADLQEYLDTFLALNPNTPEDVLYALAERNQDNYAIEVALSYNPNAPEDLKEVNARADEVTMLYIGYNAGRSISVRDAGKVIEDVIDDRGYCLEYWEEATDPDNLYAGTAYGIDVCLTLIPSSDMVDTLSAAITEKLCELGCTSIQIGTENLGIY